MQGPDRLQAAPPAAGFAREDRLAEALRPVAPAPAVPGLPALPRVAQQATLAGAWWARRAANATMRSSG